MDLPPSLLGVLFVVAVMLFVTVGLRMMPASNKPHAAGGQAPSHDDSSAATHNSHDAHDAHDAHDGHDAASRDSEGSSPAPRQPAEETPATVQDLGISLVCRDEAEAVRCVHQLWATADGFSCVHIQCALVVNDRWVDDGQLDALPDNAGVTLIGTSAFHGTPALHAAAIAELTQAHTAAPLAWLLVLDGGVTAIQGWDTYIRSTLAAQSNPEETVLTAGVPSTVSTAGSRALPFALHGHNKIDPEDGMPVLQWAPQATTTGAPRNVPAAGLGFDFIAGAAGCMQRIEWPNVSLDAPTAQFVVLAQLCDAGVDVRHPARLPFMFHGKPRARHRTGTATGSRRAEIEMRAQVRQQFNRPGNWRVRMRRVLRLPPAIDTAVADPFHAHTRLTTGEWMELFHGARRE